jgi:hypothetical protein
MQVRRCVRLSLSDRESPRFTVRTGTQRARSPACARAFMGACSAAPRTESVRVIRCHTDLEESAEEVVWSAVRSVKGRTLMVGVRQIGSSSR